MEKKKKFRKKKRILGRKLMFIQKKWVNQTTLQNLRKYVKTTEENCRKRIAYVLMTLLVDEKLNQKQSLILGINRC